MKISMHSVVLVILAALALPARAVTIVQCEDDKGHRTYESTCPPGTKQVNETDYHTGASKPARGADQGAPDLTGTLYVVPDCPSCDTVREFLGLRHVNYTEKNVKDDVKLQAELKEKAGELRVPTLVIGDQVVMGADRTQLLAALTKLGFDTGNAQGSGEAPAGGEQPEAGAEPAGGETPPSE